jgi:uncharacterized protein (DUF1330 family)
MSASSRFDERSNNRSRYAGRCERRAIGEAFCYAKTVLEDDLMKANFKLAIALAAGAAIGGMVVQGLHAQTTPPSYVVTDISEITDPEGFKAVISKAAPSSLVEFGGKYVIRTENIVPVEGVAPKRFVVIAFDSLEKSKAWLASQNPKEIRAIRAKTTKSRQFIVEGM